MSKQGVFALVWLFGHGTLLIAGTIPVSGFDQVTDNMFCDLNLNNALGNETLGPVTISPIPNILNGGFGLFNTPYYLPPVPGNRSGAFDDYSGALGPRPLTLNFSQPVAAFGATFVHELQRGGFDSPVVVRVFSGGYGTGELLGTVTDSLGAATDVQASADFVGLWSDTLNIRSVVIDSAWSTTGGYALDGYAISLTPVPEPTPFSLLLLGVVAFGFGFRVKTSRGPKLLE